MAEIEAPDWLSGDALTFWKIVTHDLVAEKMLRPSHHNALARYCDYLARWLRLREKVNKQGESYETESRHGRMQRLNPDFTALTRVESILADLEAKFGLTPDARQKILQLRARMQQGNLPFPPGDGEDGRPDDDGDESPLGLLN
ncbi:MAG: phage terminase small subunit P27 family [Dichotomicrobium sp.]